MVHFVECRGCGKVLLNCECKKAQVRPNPITPKNTQNFGQMSTVPVQTTNMGWKCPGCGSCYAPHVQKCYNCGVPTYATL